MLYKSLTLPDSSAVDVNLHGVGRVARLVIVEDEDVPAEGVDTGRVHRCILGKRVMTVTSSRLYGPNKHRPALTSAVLLHPPPASVPALNPAGRGRCYRHREEVGLLRSRSERHSGRTEEELLLGRPGWAPAWRSSDPPSGPASPTESGSAKGRRRSCRKKKKRLVKM